MDRWFGLAGGLAVAGFALHDQLVYYSAGPGWWGVVALLRARRRAPAGDG